MSYEHERQFETGTYFDHPRNYAIILSRTIIITFLLHVSKRLLPTIRENWNSN
jgi:hypothetical protein